MARIIGHLRSVLSVVHGFRRWDFALYRYRLNSNMPPGAHTPSRALLVVLGELDKSGCRVVGLIWNEGNGVEF